MDRLISIAVVLVACVGYTDVCAADEAARSQARNDNVVLEMVLADLTEYDKPNRPFGLGRVPRIIYFSPFEINGKPDASKPLTVDHVWAAMTNAEQRAVREAITDVGKRHDSHSFVRNFASKNTAIRLVDEPTERDKAGGKIPYGVLYPIQAWPPGYSDDHLCVVVHLYFPEFLHPSYATYVLISEGDKWTIKFRGLLTYA